MEDALLIVAQALLDIDYVALITLKQLSKRFRDNTAKIGNYTSFTFGNICSAAAKRGDLRVIQAANSKGCPYNVWTCDYAVRGGHLEILKWLHSEQRCLWNASTCAYAAMFGHLEVLQWLRSEGCPWNSWTCSQHVFESHPHIYKWAVDNGCPQF